MADGTPKRTTKRAAPKPARTKAPKPVRVPDSPTDGNGDEVADWHRRVIDRSLRSATQKSIDRGASLIVAAARLLGRSGGDSFTVQEVADEAGQSLRTLYQYFESKDDLLLALFEEAMREYARLIRESVDPIHDPLERLAGAVIAATSMPADNADSPGAGAGLARLRLRLGEVRPELVARSQAPVVSLFRELYAEAAATGQIVDHGEQRAVYMITALTSALIISRMLGNESGLDLPDHVELARFCLQGLGVTPDDDWYARVRDQVRVPTDSLLGSTVRLYGADGAAPSAQPA